MLPEPGLLAGSFSSVGAFGFKLPRPPLIAERRLPRASPGGFDGDGGGGSSSLVETLFNFAGDAF
jgi:hypothetical protein